MRIMIENTKPTSVENPELAYKPHKRTPKMVYEHGKWRKIYMPEIHEQWLHHIIILVIKPILMRYTYKYSFGSIPKRGGHYGKKVIRRYIQSGNGIKYFAKLDIRHFFDSISTDILMEQLEKIITDSWFLYIIRKCYDGFKRGLALGFYISQWLANFYLYSLDMKFQALGLTHFRYVDDIVVFYNSKKYLQNAIIEIKKFLGRFLRLRLKNNYQICRFFYEKNNCEIGRPLDYMGFVFFRNKTIIRKSIMLQAVRKSNVLRKQRVKGRRYHLKNLRQMISLIGWFTHTDSYDCYINRIKPNINIRKAKKIISIMDRRCQYDKLDSRNLCRVA